MMALQYSIWGAWLPLIFGYLPSLGFSPAQQSWILNAFPLSAIVGMFFSNQYADRHFSAERFLALSHLVGGLAILGAAFTREFWPFFGAMLVHCLFYVPTLSIVNSVAFAHMQNAQKEFGVVRMGGTLGWVLAAWPFTFIFVDWAKVDATPVTGAVEWLGVVLGSGLSGAALTAATKWTFIVAGVASLALAAFSFLLPPTPARAAAAGGDRLAWIEALKLLRHPFILVLWLIALVDSFVHNCYFNWTGTFLASPAVGIPGNWIMPVMSIGQVTEILTMFILGATLKRLGWRATLIIGVLGHAARFAVYAFGAQHQGLIIVIQIIHGICYAFFFATVYIFVDAYFPKDVRASAQGLFNVMILGVGALVANSICPYLLQRVFTDPATQVVDFRGLFLVPLALSMFAALGLALLFHPPLPAAPAD